MTCSPDMRILESWCLRLRVRREANAHYLRQARMPQRLFAPILRGCGLLQS